MTITNEMHLRLAVARERLHDGWTTAYHRPREASDAESASRYVLRVIGSGKRTTRTGVRDAWRVRVDGVSEGATQLWVDKQTGGVLSEEMMNAAGHVIVRVDWHAN